MSYPTIIELEYSEETKALDGVAAGEKGWEEIEIIGLLEEETSFRLDRDYLPVKIDVDEALAADLLAEGIDVRGAYFVIRGTITGDKELDLARLRNFGPPLRNAFDDPLITTAADCSRDGSTDVSFLGPTGNFRNVRERCRQVRLQCKGMTGHRVYLAMVDSGVSRLFLFQRHSIALDFDRALSWAPPGTSYRPGNAPAYRSHGTIMAYDAWLMAPRYTLLDFPVIRTDFDDLLSNAIAAYKRMTTWLQAFEPAQRPALVINNSWQLVDPDGPGAVEYRKPTGAFNTQIHILEKAGADILFAAGNCGNGSKCEKRGPETIYGANSHPKVLSVGAVTINRCRLSLSSQGPGDIQKEKPDFCTYSHFKGAEVPGRKIDSGTSAACAVASGIVAAIRSNPNYSSQLLPPSTLRQYIWDASDVRGATFHEPNYGYGILDVDRLLNAL